jgi:hypothetical protein
MSPDDTSAVDEALQVRENPALWFYGYAKVEDEISRMPVSPGARVLQKRMFREYVRAQKARRPCRMLVVKTRREGSSTGGTAIDYVHALNYKARIALIGTNYRSSHTLMRMLRHYGQHDQFPGWGLDPGGRVTTQLVEWEDRTLKDIETRIEWAHGSEAELYTASNPESARSAAIQCLHGTEVGRWPKGGAKDGMETLNAMLKTVPKRGFCFVDLESTPNGISGVFNETWVRARWPEEETWWKKFEHLCPQNTVELGGDLQFVRIFAAWWESPANGMALTEKQIGLIKHTLTEREAELIAAFGQPGPRGDRLGDIAHWNYYEQLAWRRMVIQHECAGSERQFQQEYPEDPYTCWLASGSPWFDMRALSEMETAARGKTPEYGRFSQQRGGQVVYERCGESNATAWIWEHPVEGARYLMGVDPMRGEETIDTSGERDRHSAIVVRDAFIDGNGVRWPAREVARVKPPCQWNNTPFAREVFRLGRHYGDCCIAVESNQGIAVIRELRDKYHANLYIQEEFDTVTGRVTKRLGFRTDEDGRSILTTAIQDDIRDRRIMIDDMHAIGEMKTFERDANGRPAASPNHHDDDVVALGIARACRHASSEYRADAVTLAEADDYSEGV